MDSPVYLRVKEEALQLDLYVVPRASRTKLVGEYDGRLKIQISAPPVDGAANKEICVFIASVLSVSKSRVNLIRGKTGKRKTIEITGISLSDVLPFLP